VVAMLGRATGHHLHALAHNRDPRPVEAAPTPPLDRGSQRALGWRPRTAAEVDAVLTALVDRVTRRLRAADRVGRTVVRAPALRRPVTRATRSHTLPEPTRSTQEVLTAARILLSQAGPAIETGGLSLIGVTISNLDDARAVQLTLPFDRRTDPALDEAVDQVQRRFGAASLTRSALLGNRADPGVPLLPD
jgi:DNA polymerase-4